jgi:hypothetical protein
MVSELQTISVSEIGRKDLENFNIEILVNGDFWNIKTNYSKCYLMRNLCSKTGFNGGIDVIFGNEGFGLIPP